MKRWIGKARAAAKRAAFPRVPPALYLRLYARDTDRRVARDPDRASGHPESVMAPRVVAYATKAGLEPSHRLLDFGCGTLRTGKYFIDLLERRRYVGVDVSRGAIEHARAVVSANRRLRTKEPVLRAVEPFEDLDLPWSPDFILCHSVFTHLPRGAAARTFRQLRRVMAPDTTLGLSAFVGDRYEQHTYKDVRYPQADLVEMAREAGIRLRRLDGRTGLRQTIFVGGRMDAEGPAGSRA